jgi:hypothetical protein
MPFVKLDTGILDSTLWIEKEQRDVFITALLMAEPREFLDPIPQIRIGDLELTGFEAPPGWYGFVPAASTGIINRAGVDKESGMEALRRLGEPEAESRSKEFEGRRMIRMNGGFIILNYMKYRDKDHTAAERQRRLRERRKSVTVTRYDAGVTRDVTQQSRDVTQAESREQMQRADAEGEKQEPPPDSGSELALASWVFEEANVPCDNSMVRYGGECIRKLAREAGVSYRDAAQVILEAMKLAIRDGTRITRFWLADQEYKPGQPKKTSKRAELEQERAEMARRVEESLNAE